MSLSAIALVLLAPAALASAHGPVQVTGKQLKSALIPATGFLPGYGVVTGSDSGGKLEHGAMFNLPSMPCQAFWPDIGVVPGFGDSAFATEVVGYRSGIPSVIETFEQSVYQFTSTHAASSFFAELNAKYRSCPSVTVSDPGGLTLRWTVRARSTQHVGGHQALQLAENQTDSKLPGPPLKIDAVWTIDGTDVYLISTTLVNTNSPKPAQFLLILKLIARVQALR